MKILALGRAELKILLVLASAFSFFTCRTIPQSDSQASYAISYQSREVFRSKSALSMIDRGAGALTVTLAFKNFQQAPTADQKLRIKNTMTQAITTWIAGLRPIDNWKWPNVKIVYNEDNIDAVCREDASYWNCDHGSSIKLIVDNKANRSYANMDHGLVLLEGSYLNPSDPTLRDASGMNKNLLKLLMHEFGHVMGLGDTYAETGYQNPQNSPKAVMNSFFSVDTLTDDDRAGLRALWAFINGAENICTDSYRVETATENTNSNKFCVPKFLPPNVFTNPEASYLISTSWLGPDQTLTFDSTYRVSLTTARAKAPTRWRFILQHGNQVKILPVSKTGGNACLDIDPASKQPILRPCGPASGQIWILEEPSPGSGTYSLKTVYTGTSSCLDVANSGNRDQLYMNSCSNISGQVWHIESR